MNANQITSLLNKPFVLGYQVRPAIETLAHSICGSLGLAPVRVKWERETQTASMDTDGNLRIAIPADDARITRPVFVKYVGFVIHELLHRKYTQFSLLRHGFHGFQVSNPQYLRALHNAVEDAWIERTGIAAGFTGNIERVLHTLIEVMIQECTVSDWADPAVYPFSLAVYTRRYPTAVPVPAALKPIFDEACRRLDKSTGTADNIHIAKWVYDQLRSVSDEDGESGQPGESGDSGESGESGEESGEGSGEGSDKGEGSGSGTGSGDGEGSESGDGSGEGSGEGSGSPSEGPQGDDQGQGEGEGATRGKKGSEQTGPARRFDDRTEPVEVEPTAHPGEGNVGPGTFDSGYDVRREGYHRRNCEQEINSSANAALKNLLRRAFENTDTSEYDKGRKAGAFDVKAIERWATGSTNIFQRRQEKGGIESAVIILIDCSSSMDMRISRGKSRIRCSIESAAAIYESLAAAGVSTGVYTFCSVVSAAVPIGTPFAKGKKLLSQVDTYGSTNDFQAVQHCHHVLLAQPQQRKVLLVLTDGAGNAYAVKKQCEAAQKLGITTIGIGIGMDATAYPLNATINSASELAQSALGKLIAAARV